MLIPKPRHLALEILAARRGKDDALRFLHTNSCYRPCRSRPASALPGGRTTRARKPFKQSRAQRPWRSACAEAQNHRSWMRKARRDATGVVPFAQHTCSQYPAGALVSKLSATYGESAPRVVEGAENARVRTPPLAEESSRSRPTHTVRRRRCRQSQTCRI